MSYANYHQMNHSSDDQNDSSDHLLGEDNSSGDPSSEFPKPIGLTGLQNLGNTCYMNAALQALSNCPQLTGFMMDCGPYIRKPGLAKTFWRLINDMWSNRRPGYVVPAGISQGIKKVCPSFKGYAQHDAQEFLRCLLDQLHEELKEPILDPLGSDPMPSHHNHHHHHSCHHHHNRCGHSSSCSQYHECHSGRIRHHSSSSAGPLQDANRFNECSQHHPHHHSQHDVMMDFSERNVDDDEHMSSDSNEYVSCDSGLSVEKVPSEEPTVPILNGHNDMEISNSETTLVGLSMDGISCTIDGQSLDPTQEPLPSAPINHQQVDHLSLGYGSLNGTMLKGGNHSSASSTGTTDSPDGSTKSKTVYRSIISDIFDGKLVSSVQCLTCHNVSTTNETFQDLSLSIPTRDQLNSLRTRSASAAGMTSVKSSDNIMMSTIPESGRSSPNNHSLETQSLNSGSVTSVNNQVVPPSILWQWIEWFFGWLWGPTITLEDCLSAFFSADELKGDNMYSCEKCKKLRNGIKYSRVYHLPDILCIHLKRFRHELMYSSKISSQVTFPMEGLDLAPYMVQNSPHQMNPCHNCSGPGLELEANNQSEKSDAPISTYDLVAVICHHGTPASGHYTAYCLNSYSDTWYEFDDQYVTAVDPHQVASCEAYVLFYRKTNDEVYERRHRAVQLIDRCSSEALKKKMSAMNVDGDTRLEDKQYYVSNQWINRFNTFADPGPISNNDFLCEHGFVAPAKLAYAKDLCTVFSQEIWEYLFDKYGGGPVCHELILCQKCSLRFVNMIPNGHHDHHLGHLSGLNIANGSFFYKMNK